MFASKFAAGVRQFASNTRLQSQKLFTSAKAAPSAQKTLFTVGVVGTTAAGFFAYSQYNKAHADSKKELLALSPDEWRSFKLREIQKLNHNTSVFRFELQSPEHKLGMPVASCVLTKGTKNEPKDAKGNPVVRPYTPITYDEKGFVDFLIKQYPNGPMSTHFHELKPGDTLDIKGPLKKLQIEPNMKKKIGMIAGGTGITPMLQVIHEVLKNPKDKTELSLIFANIGEEDILLKDRLDSMAKKYSNFKVFYVVEKPGKNWTQGVGYVTEEQIKKYMPAPSDDSLVLVCGPGGMMNFISGNKAPDYSQGELSGLLKKMNYTSSQVYKF
jgi:cytochrome-b5 reductase